VYAIHGARRAHTTPGRETAISGSAEGGCALL
jgi:hypothetical protein